MREGTAFVWRNPRCPVRMRVAGGVIFEGRADKLLGYLTRGVVNFGKNARHFPAVAVNHLTGYVL